MNNQTGLNIPLLARVLAIRHQEKMQGIGRPIKLSPSIHHTVDIAKNVQSKNTK